jgi:hypothetical protein
MKKAVFYFVLLFILSATHASALSVKCPSMVLNGIAGFPAEQGAADAATNNDLICRFSPVTLFEFASFSSWMRGDGLCPNRTYTASVSGGMGTWQFGSPGTPDTMTLRGQFRGFSTGSLSPWYKTVLGCQYVEADPPALAVWSTAPIGDSCSPSAGAFTCTALPQCPQSLKGSSIPTTAWSASSGAPGWYLPGFAAVGASGAGNNFGAGGSTITLGVVMNSINAAAPPSFSNEQFSLTGAPTDFPPLPNNVIECIYQNTVAFPNLILTSGSHEPGHWIANVAIVCPVSCGSL